MFTKNSIWVLFAILVISGLVLGSAIQVGAETLNLKFYSYVVKAEKDPIGDVEGHIMGVEVRKAFVVLENGEVATGNSVNIFDFTKFSGPFSAYSTFKFSDGSTIILKNQGTVGATSGGWMSEIIHGTGRFEGIKGTATAKTKYLPVEAGELGPKGYGEGTLTYTLPSK